MRSRAWWWGATVLALVGLAGPRGASAAAVLFEDNFDHGTMKPEWESILCCQRVRDGWLYTEDTDGWPRDSMALVHDGDASWTDYTVSLTADFAKGTPFEHFNILLRTDGFARSSELQAGRAYELEFLGPSWEDQGQGPGPRIILWRSDYDAEPDQGPPLYNQEFPVSRDPMHIQVSLVGGRITLWVDGTEVFTVTDPEPFLAGGIGVHATWESMARFDDIVVTGVKAGGVGGSVTGLRPALIVCENLTTQQTVVIGEQAPSWNCEAAGLEVTPDDLIRITLVGGAN